MISSTSSFFLEPLLEFRTSEQSNPPEKEIWNSFLDDPESESVNADRPSNPSEISSPSSPFSFLSSSTSRGNIESFSLDSAPPYSSETPSMTTDPFNNCTTKKTSRFFLQQKQTDKLDEVGNEPDDKIKKRKIDDQKIQSRQVDKNTFGSAMVGNEGERRKLGNKIAAKKYRANMKAKSQEVQKENERKKIEFSANMKAQLEAVQKENAFFRAILNPSVIQNAEFIKKTNEELRDNEQIKKEIKDLKDKLDIFDRENVDLKNQLQKAKTSCQARDNKFVQMISGSR